MAGAHIMITKAGVTAVTDRTVTTRLRLDSTGWVAGQRAATASNDRLSASARAAATSAQRDAQRTAQAVAGTFTGMARTGEAALGRLDAAATRSSQALARNAATMSRQTAAAAAAAARATTQAGATAAASTRTVTAAAGQIPATFRAGSTAAVGALGRIDAAAAGSRAQVARTLLAQRQALTASAAAVTQTSAGIASVTASGVAGSARLSLASRLTLAQAAAASQAAAAGSAATVARLSTAQRLAQAGASRAAAAAAASTARADANARALTTTFGAAGARARVMGSAVVTAAGNSQRSLKATRNASLLVVAAFGLAVYASSKFETAMSGVKAATQAGARELAQLRQAAIQAGATTQYSATQAAHAEMELAKAGVSTADILGGALRGTLSLAAAGQMDVADSAVVASKAMNAFGLNGAQMSHIADVIAAAAGKSATDVHGLSLAMAQSALLAHQTGLTLEQTAGSLALFAQNGLVGSDAGTSLKTMLMRLTPQSQEARDMMAQLGFSAYDASGNFVGLSETARRMQKSFGGLTPEARNAAMGVIFGSDAIRAATIVTQAGAQGIDAWTRAANDQGYAAKYAATQTDNLQGDLQRLKSALETALIQSGSAANGVLRDMAQALTGVVRWYSSLSPAVQKTVTVLGGLAGMVGLVAAGLLLMLPRIVRVRTELTALGLTAERTGALLGVMGRLTVVIGGLMALSYAGNKLSSIFEHAAPSVDKMTSSLVDLARTGTATGEAAKTFGDDLDGFGDAVKRIAHPGALGGAEDSVQKFAHGVLGSSHSLKDAQKQVKAVDEALAAMVSSGHADLAAKSFTKLASEAEKNGTSTKKLRTLLPQYTSALDGADAQQKLTADSSKALGDQADATADDLRDTRTEAEKLTDALDALNGVNITAAEASISFQQDLADLRKAVKDNGHSLDVTSEKGRKVKDAFLNAADGAMKAAEAVAAQTGSTDAGNRVLAQNVEAIRRQMLAMGFQRQTVDHLLASYARLPNGVTTTVAVSDKATAELESIQRKLAGTKGKSVTVKALTKDAEGALRDLGFKVTHLKNGSVKITAPTKGAMAAIKSLKDYLATLRDKSITVTTNLITDHRTINTGKGGRGPNAQANGSVRRYAGGGMEQHVAQIARAGEWRVWAEDETGGEAYIPLAASKRLRSRAIAEETVRRLGGKGVAWNAAGGVRAYAGGGFSYSPAEAASTLGGPGAGTDRYTASVDRLKAAWEKLNSALADQRSKASAVQDAEKNLTRVRSGHHTAKQLADAEDKLTRARAAATKAASATAAARKGVNAADAYLGLASGAKAPTGFDLKAYSKQLALAAAANSRWESGLSSIGKRAGADVAETLRGMGQDGEQLVARAGEVERQDVRGYRRQPAEAGADGEGDPGRLHEPDQGVDRGQQVLPGQPLAARADGVRRPRPAAGRAGRRRGGADRGGRGEESGLGGGREQRGVSERQPAQRR
jgi:TP901 family phage tail tape measure protein